MQSRFNKGVWEAWLWWGVGQAAEVGTWGMDPGMYIARPYPKR